MGLVLVEMKASQTAQSFLDIMREVSRSNHGFDHLRGQVLKWDVIVCETIGIGDRNTEILSIHWLSPHRFAFCSRGGQDGGFNRFNPREHPSDKRTIAQCQSFL